MTEDISCKHRLRKYVSRSVDYCFEGEHFISITGEIIDNPYKDYKAGQREYLTRLAKGHVLITKQKES